MKLKTLKDLTFQHDCGECETCKLRNKIKAEAVKWVKEWKKKEYNKKRKIYDMEIVNKISCFIEFFNIIEEDLT